MNSPCAVDDDIQNNKARDMTKIIPVAIITGASRGIGKAITRKLSQEGISCLAIASTRESIENIRIDDHLFYVNKNQRHRSLAIDLSQWPQWISKDKHFGIDYQSTHRPSNAFYSLFDMCSSWAQGNSDTKYCLDLLVNCAGVTQNSLGLRTSNEDITKIMNVNFMSCVSMCNLAIKQMLRSRKRYPFSPSVINISSILSEGDLVVPGTSVYAASKAALTQYTKVIARESESWNISVSSLSPGLVKNTDMIGGLNATIQSQLDQIMNHEHTTTEEIASKVWHLYNSRRTT